MGPDITNFLSFLDIEKVQVSEILHGERQRLTCLSSKDNAMAVDDLGAQGARAYINSHCNELVLTEQYRQEHRKGWYILRLTQFLLNVIL